MSRRNALKLARDAGLVDKVDCSDDWFVREDAGIEQVVQFAALIAAAEREACAKMFDGEVWAYDYREIAAAIRARGEA